MIIKEIVNNLINEAYSTDKHVLKIDTIRERAQRHIGAQCPDENHEVLYSIGMDQLIYQWLHAYGFYSVRVGRFVNPDNCKNAQYLEKILERSENDLEGRQKALNRLKALRDGQLSMLIVDNDWLGVDIPMTEEEFLDYLEADSV